MAHFTDEQIRGFSRRSAQIEEGLAAMGLTRETADAQTKSRVSMATRDKKTDDYSREDIHKEWVNRANELGIDFNDSVWAGKGKDGPQTSMNTVPNFTSPEVKADRAIQLRLNPFQSAMRLLTSPDCWPWQIKGYRPGIKAGY